MSRSGTGGSRPAQLGVTEPHPQEAVHTADVTHDDESLEPADAGWRDWEDYADLVTVELRFKEWPGADDMEEFWVVQSSGAAWSREWLTRRAVEVVTAETGSASFLLDARDRRTEWGASAAVFEVVLTVAQDQLSNATWLAIGALAHRMAILRRKSREAPGAPPSEDCLDDQRVREAAISAVSRFRGAQPTDLEVRSVELENDQGVAVEIRDRVSDVAFGVQVRIESSDVFVARVRKVTEPGSTS